MKRVAYLSIADIEMTEAAQRYDSASEGLGRAFLDAIRATENRIQRNPQLWPFRAEPVRSCRVRRFPYRVHYVDEPDRILIVAVAHAKRDPDYWKERLSGYPGQSPSA